MLQPPIVPRVRHVGDARNFHEYPEQNWQKWYEIGAEVSHLLRSRSYFKHLGLTPIKACAFLSVIFYCAYINFCHSLQFCKACRDLLKRENYDDLRKVRMTLKSHGCLKYGTFVRFSW